MKIADISRWNPITSWPQVASEVDTLLIRSSTGDRADPTYVSNWQASRSAGIPKLGIYHYYVTETAPLAQLSFLLNLTAGDFGNEAFVLDCERREDEKLKPFDRITYTRNLLTFLFGWKQATSHPIRIYTSRVEWIAITTLPSLDPSIGLHVAHWNQTITQPDIPPGWPTWLRWQFTRTGRVLGITGNIDLSRDNLVVTTPTPSPISSLANGIIKLGNQIKQELA